VNIGVTISQLYPDAAEANALRIQGVPVSGVVPQNGQVLVFNASINEYVPAAAGGSGLPAGFSIEALSNTRIKISYTGTDSITRSVALTIG
jgi:hypothetical protein